MDATVKTQHRPKGVAPIIVTYTGYAFILLGLVSGANYLFGLELAIKGHVLPADWKIALLGIVGGVGVALWGHALDSQAFQHLVSRNKWIPWVVWPMIVIVALAAVFLAVR
jgi:hypothetical protein